MPTVPACSFGKTSNRGLKKKPTNPPINMGEICTPPLNQEVALYFVALSAAAPTKAAPHNRAKTTAATSTAKPASRAMMSITIENTWAPKVCKIMAFMAIIMGLGLLFYIHLGFRYYDCCYMYYNYCNIYLYCSYYYSTTATIITIIIGSVFAMIAILDGTGLTTALA